MRRVLQRVIHLVDSAFKNSILLARNKPLKLIGVNFEVTDACNSRCKHCNIWRRKPTKDILTPKEVEKIFSNDLFKELKEVQLTGGEPTLRSDFEEIIFSIHKILPNVRIGIATNGLLPERVIELVKTTIRHDVPICFGIPLDGIGEKHDLIRGVKGNFEKVDFLLHELIALGEKYPGKIGVGVGFTLSNLTVDALGEVIKYLQRMNKGILIQMYEEAPYYDNIGNSNIKNLNNYRLIKAVQQLPPSFHNELLLKGLKRPLRFRCFAMQTFFSLRCNGDVAPCLRFGNIKVGNLKENSFSEVWNSSTAREARKLVKDCHGCLNSWATDWSFESYFPSMLDIAFRAFIKRAIARLRSDRSSC